MSLLYIYDPSNEESYGALYFPSPVPVNQVLSGAWFEMEISEVVCSQDIEELFDLSSPPSFFASYQVTCRLNPNDGTLRMYLATSRADTTYPFADLYGFDAAIDRANGRWRDTADDSATLHRHNVLPREAWWYWSLTGQ